MRTTITVHVGRDTIDPQGLGSDEDVAAIEASIMDEVRAEWPNADVRAVGNGGRTSGTDADGHDITAEVRAFVNAAFERACAAL